MINIEDSMKNLSPQQRQEADQLFSRALQCAKNNDMVGAANYYRQSADMSHPGAQNNLGNQYKNGRGVNKDPQEAVRLFTLSARQGNVFGMRNLASCYLDGIGQLGVVRKLGAKGLAEIKEKCEKAGIKIK